jgi:intracellular sulfur oxidation DsrE/DsrF family protein
MTTTGRRRLWGWIGGAAVAAAAAPARVWAQGSGPGARRGVVFQVTDADPAKWQLALNNLRSLQAEFGADKVELELVAFGPGVRMLTKDSAVGEPLAQALHANVRVVACHRTMQALHLGPADLLPDVGIVPYGVAEVVLKQQQGWAYIRP